MKKLLKYPFLCLLLVTMAAAAPFMWQQIGLLPQFSAREEVSADQPQLQGPETPILPQAPETEDPPGSSDLPEADAPPEGTGDSDSPSEGELPPPPPNKPPIQLPGTDAEPDAPKAPLPPENPFENALFIGDSRTVGICKYSGITEADFFASTGMSVYDVFKEQLEVGGQKARSLETLLRDQQYDRIYLMLGINELGYNFDKTVKTYGGVVDKLRELQPGAYIHIQANLHVTKEKSDRDKLYNNTNINRLNEAISALADGETVFYLDVNPTFDDENGCLAADLTWDGVHLLGKYYSSWADWLRENTPA